MQNWVVIVANPAKKTLKKLSQKDVDRILKSLDELFVNPYEGDVKPIQGQSGLYRKRVGVFRILFEMDTKRKIVFVEAIRRRTSTTY